MLEIHHSGREPSICNTLHDSESILCQIIVIEGGKVLRKQKEGGAFARNSGYVMREVVWKVYKVCLVFWFGVVVTHFSTNVPKYAIGRLVVLSVD